MTESKDATRETKIRDAVNYIIDKLDMDNATALPSEQKLLRMATFFDEHLDDDAKAEVVKRVNIEYFQY